MTLIHALASSRRARRAFSWPRALMLTAGLLGLAGNALAGSILFIGNSFTYADKSPVHYYRADTVTDLNSEGIGGMPALFKSFTVQAGLNYDVYLETEPGVGIDWHLDHKTGIIGQRAWDAVVMHGYSTLDPKKPGDPAVLVDTVRRMSDLLRARNPAVDIRVMATWPRADQVFDAKGAWYGKSIDAMTHDVRAGYDQAAAATPGLKPVIPVGEAWLRAIQTGVADGNPYDGIDAGKVDLWSYDNYHASAFGYYLEALVVFGSVTGLDPRSLGDNECSGFELGLSTAQVAALQQVAFDELATTHAVKPAPLKLPKPSDPVRCVSAR
ncbi:PEP-CTERM sorting domain-containing protein [Pararobbsia silviterrae]|uniref:PEP-CTERM sorting domain-containing protein n=1 Tax=Pararobbsia silviterrae TaxID=1792498 RepID=UPI001981BD8F|nr:PEP-CTERM sorting domain-containing protein [Pararobbsia silviterrae]